MEKKMKEYNTDISIKIKSGINRAQFYERIWGKQFDQYIIIGKIGILLFK
ncbi:unnamed protein product [Paramecium sonneborni]|uniref:Uncharacterized protein n=1 Tax=Paramecium sonneborni TaxID=65129 RepID=A0A8S1LWY6_9CILI|nr:unnamed protein product [Paramecium sonneborni]